MFLIFFLCLLSCFVCCFLFPVFCVLVFFCVLFLLLYTAVFFPNFIQLYRPLSRGGNPIAANKYYNKSNATSFLAFITLYFFRLTPSDHFLLPSVFKIEKSSHTDSHATQTEGEAYNSVPVHLLITPVSLATSIGTARITFCQREVMKNMLQNRGDSEKASNKDHKKERDQKQMEPHVTILHSDDIIIHFTYFLVILLA